MKSIPIDIYKKKDELNIAGFFPVTNSLGPGQRALIWLQGCMKHCRDCITQKMREIKEKELVEVQAMAKLLSQIKGNTGVTIVGGEPMLQVPALSMLFSLIKKDYGISTMIYTGYYLEQLIALHDPRMSELLKNTDILVDGPYIKSLDYSQKWRGSENQTIHFFSKNYKNLKWVMENRNRDVEIHFNNAGQYLVLGIPTKKLFENFYKI